MTTLVTVAQKAVARFYRHGGPGQPLEEIGRIDHPESAMKNHELATDGPGSVVERMGPQVRAMQPEQLPKEREAANFAREVAEVMRRARLSNEFARAVVIASPAFLGLLRASLGEPERRFVSDEIPKNVAALEQPAVEAALEDVLRIGNPRR